MFSHQGSKIGADSSVRFGLDSRRFISPYGAWLVFAALLFFGYSLPVPAQITANIKGAITDPSQAAVPSANVVVRNMETNVLRTVSSDSTGNYLVLALPVGVYEGKVI